MLETATLDPTVIKQQFADPARSIVHDYRSDSDNLLVSFGGYDARAKQPRFQFKGASANWPARKIFVRDIPNAFYSAGMPGLTANIEETADLLRQEIHQLSPTHTVFIGNSAGGYAAALIGAWLNIDSVIAIAPPITYSIIRCIRLGTINRVIASVVANTWKQVIGKPRYPSLDYALAEVEFDTRVHVYYSTDHRADTVSAELLGRVPGISTHPYPRGGHLLATMLHQTGELDAIVEAALAGQDIPLDAAAIAGT